MVEFLTGPIEQLAAAVSVNPSDPSVDPHVTIIDSVQSALVSARREVALDFGPDARLSDLRRLHDMVLESRNVVSSSAIALNADDSRIVDFSRDALDCITTLQGQVRHLEDHLNPVMDYGNELDKRQRFAVKTRTAFAAFVNEVVDLNRTIQDQTGL